MYLSQMPCFAICKSVKVLFAINARMKYCCKIARYKRSFCIFEFYNHFHFHMPAAIKKQEIGFAFLC